MSLDACTHASSQGWCCSPCFVSILGRCQDSSKASGLLGVCKDDSASRHKVHRHKGLVCLRYARQSSSPGNIYICDANSINFGAPVAHSYKPLRLNIYCSFVHIYLDCFSFWFQRANQEWHRAHVNPLTFVSIEPQVLKICSWVVAKA
jgi:hypothetical protein